MKSKVCLIWSETSQNYFDCLPSNQGRSSLVHSLIKAYDLFKELIVIPPSMATAAEIVNFHSKEFACYLLTFTSHAYSTIQIQLFNSYFGLEDDCFPFPEVSNYVRYVAGGTLTAANCINNGTQIALFWDGGRHHAKQNSAAGFCYVNDLVLGIGRLLQKFDLIFYFDLDLHHGDGVEEAFRNENRIFVASIHRYDRGFYPGSGFENGETQLNVPLGRGLNDKGFKRLITEIVGKVVSEFQPNAIVLQCGVDGLAGDPFGEWNLTSESYVFALETLLSLNLPLLVTGGGGYNHANVARVYAQLTAVCVKKQPENDIPEHDHFLEFGPSFELQIDAAMEMDQSGYEAFVTKELNA